MLPELGAKPRVYYLNIPKKFIGGTVYDPVEKEVIEEATCTLTETKTGKKYTATTDGFGDFWFEKLNVGTFSLKHHERRQRRSKSTPSAPKKMSTWETSP